MLLTLGAHAQRGLQYLGLCVCLSVKSHLTYGESVRLENSVTYSAGNEGQKICGIFSETAPSQRSSNPPLTAIRTVGHFSCEMHACALWHLTTWCGTKRPFLPV